jgi:transposase
VKLITERGVKVAQASQDLGVHATQLRQWVRDFEGSPQQAFPGHGQMKPEQAEIARLKREVTKLKAERDILKKAAACRARGRVSWRPPQLASCAQSWRSSPGRCRNECARGCHASTSRPPSFRERPAS